MTNKSILIVDDDQGMIDVIDKYLRNLGYQTRKALDGLEAIKILQEEDCEIDLLITDLVMPNLSGPKLIKIVKKEYRQIKIIACTGHGKKAGQWADDAGADAILYKPLEMYRLKRTIEDLI
jgi:two-component system cell cycle sensor histidine kinase/response regulator CckA